MKLFLTISIILLSLTAFAQKATPGTQGSHELKIPKAAPDPDSICHVSLSQLALAKYQANVNAINTLNAVNQEILFSAANAKGFDEGKIKSQEGKMRAAFSNGEFLFAYPKDQLPDKGATGL